MTAADLSHLPRAKPTREGLVPDAEPRFVQVLVEKWAAEADDDKPTALGTPFRHSDAGACARKIAYVAAGIPKSDRMDLSGWWNTGLGTRIHEMWQDALEEMKGIVGDRVAAMFPGRVAISITVQVEPKVAMVGADGSGHLDAVITITFEDGGTYVVVVELKTIGGYGYKAATGTARKGTPAEGPKAEHILQAAINGLAVDADEIVVAYLSKESISVAVAERFGASELERICCEWTFTREQYEPLAREEAARVAAILGRVEKGQLAPRRIPGSMPKGAEVVDPGTGAWRLMGETDPDTGYAMIVDSGSVWNCGYCSYQTLCKGTEPGIIEIKSVKS